MLVALLVCSDGACAEPYEAAGPLDELDALGCDCGCWLQPLRWAAAGDRSRRGNLELTPIG